MGWWTLYRKLSDKGILGINGRNADYIAQYNERKHYPNADSKLRSKRIALSGGIPVPELYGVIQRASQMDRVYAVAQEHGFVVLKPEHGAGGEGIHLLQWQDGELCTLSGEVVSREELRVHINDTVSGLFSLGGQPDQLLMEYKVSFDATFDHVTYKGVPDIRIIVFRGVPVCSMLRLPTKQSGGKANLHQGAIGVGVDMLSGVTGQGVQGTRRVSVHPDTEEILEGLAIPYWDNILGIAAKSYSLFRLGYMGIDIVLDKEKGPLVLEVNVRPGLAIQLANNCGLRQRLSRVEEIKDIEAWTEEKRIASISELLGT